MDTESNSSSWPAVRLSDERYFKLIMGQSPPGSTYNESGQGLAFYQGKADFGEESPTPRIFCSAPSRIAEPNDILMSVRAPVGPTNLADRQCAIGRGLAAIRCKENVAPRYLLTVLRAFEGNIAHLAEGQGGGFTCIRKEQLADYEIPIPPLAEQRRIVTRVEALTRRLDQARQSRQAALVEITSCIRSLIAGVFTNCDESSFRALGEVTGIIGGSSIPENAPLPCKGDERIGLMKVSDMNAPGNEHFITSCKLETSRAAAVTRRLRILPVGAVVFPKRGGAIATNKKRVLTISAALDPNTMGVYPLPKSGLISEFLFWWFESLDLAELQEDGGIPQINKKHLDPLQIPVITEPEQRAIVARLRAMRGKLDELQRLQREVAAELASFTPALLAKAFRGEL